MAGHIAGAADAGQWARYAPHFAELIPVARDLLAEAPPLDSGTFVYHLQGLLAFEGVPVWSTELELLLDEFEVECPDCGAGSAVCLGLDADDLDVELFAADPAELTGIGARLHAFAVDGGQGEVAVRG
ncbi:hypothetical protein IAG44_33960 [Streptomyces roseirectus]|uniref:Uncharacterized protein n=1 Tax=Streptomyces roseirectus TaxID=2768066 RepID=A0A7H0IMF8_9ACTN|nr:hypothetical protein [Streptomyces roseirectus]QNP73974.1 hypothetical protein IAG44_33960 [Streptomyces roseirectus]